MDKSQSAIDERDLIDRPTKSDPSPMRVLHIYRGNYCYKKHFSSPGKLSVLTYIFALPMIPTCVLTSDGLAPRVGGSPEKGEGFCRRQ